MLCFEKKVAVKTLSLSCNVRKEEEQYTKSNQWSQCKLSKLIVQWAVNLSLSLSLC